MIAILAAIVFPVFAQARTRSRIRQSPSHLKQIGLVVMMYAEDTDGAIVHEYGAAYNTRDTWVGRMMMYVKSRAVLWDPLRSEPSGDDFPDLFYPGYVYKWEWPASFAYIADYENV